jgi:RNA polymerase sigma-70 factor, ECF subfamily
MTTLLPLSRAAKPRGKVDGMRQHASQPELATVMTRIADGDQTAFAQFYDATSRSVFGIVLHVLRDRAQAEEVTQEIYVEAWRNVSQFDASLGSPSAWINTMAHRRAVDRVRSADRSAARDQRHFEAGGALTALDTADLVAQADEGQRVRDALSTLPEAQRTALHLAYFEGRSYREVAEFLEVPLGTVKTRIRDAMKRLKGQLGEASR